MRKVLLSVLVCLFACAKSLPVEAPTEPARERPAWVNNLGAQADAMRACLALRESPHYVAFVEPLPSGASGITTVDAYDAVEHCAYFEGRILRREPAEIRIADISSARGALFALGAAQPVVPVGEVLEEVMDHGQVVGWLFWPRPEEPQQHASSQGRAP